MAMEFTRDGSNGDWGSLKMKTGSVDGRVALLRLEKEMKCSLKKVEVQQGSI